MRAGVPAAVFERDRLEVVRATGLLDTGPEEPFERLASLAAALLDTPFAFVTVVDDQRSFWKSCIGVDATELGDRQNPVEESFCQYVVGSGEELIVGDAAGDDRTRDNPSVEKMGVAAWAGFPLRAPDGQVLGSFCVVDNAVREWTPQEVEILRTLSRSAAGEVALRSAVEQERAARKRADAAAADARREAERSAELAQTLQESLLPPSLPAVAGLEVAACYRPAGSGQQVLGDFYDVFQGGRGVWHAVIGDVCGKGVEAAKVTALARYTLRAAAMGTARPSEVLSQLNEAMLQHGPDADAFLTAVFCTAEPRDDGARLRLCAAGHSVPLLRCSDGRVLEVTSRGSLLGAFPEIVLEDVDVVLERGDALVLYTDGVPEARHEGAFFGAQRLRRLLERADASDASALAKEIDEAVRGFSSGALADDVAILVLRAPAAPLGQA